MLLAAEEVPGTQRPPLVTSDAVIRERTGRGWEQWFDRLDDWGALELPHRDVARRVAADLGIDPLAWNAQAVTVSYERARGLRVVGQRSDGFAVIAQKTVAVPVGALFDAFADRSLRRRWLPENGLHERTATRPSQPGSTGVTGRPGSMSRPRTRETGRARWPWSMCGLPMPKRPSG